jgi:hypothetical protein
MFIDAVWYQKVVLERNYFYIFKSLKDKRCKDVCEAGRRCTVTKSYHFLEGRCKFPALGKQKFLFDTGKCFQLPKSYFSCHQNGKLLHSGERAVFHAWECKSPALVLNSKMNGVELNEFF